MSRGTRGTTAAASQAVASAPRGMKVPAPQRDEIPSIVPRLGRPHRMTHE